MVTHKHTQTDTLSLSLSLLYTQRAHHVPACLTCRDEAKVHTIGNAKVGKSAIVSGEHSEPIGETPPAALLVRLTQWLSKQREQLVFSTDCVSRDIPAIPELAEHCEA